MRKSPTDKIRFFLIFWVEWFSLWSFGSLGHNLRKAHEKKSEGRAGAKYASITPSSNLFLFRSLLFNPQHPSLHSHYPTPSCPPPPSSLQPATDTFCIWRVQPREQSSLSFPKISWWEREITNWTSGFGAAQPLVIRPGSGSWACLDPEPLDQYTLPTCLTDWLGLTSLLFTHSLSLSVPLPLLLPSYFPPWWVRVHRLGRCSSDLRLDSLKTAQRGFITLLLHPPSQNNTDGLFLFFLNCCRKRYKTNRSTCSWKAFQHRLCLSALVSSTGSIDACQLGGEHHVFSAACSPNIWCHYIPWETLVAEARREVEEIPTWRSHL